MELREDVKTYALETEIDGARSDDAIYITSAAIDEIKDIASAQKVPAEYYLRLGTQSGGCSGTQYYLGFDNTEVDNSKDKEFLIDEQAIVIDRASLFTLESTTIDFIEEEGKRGFVFRNPHHQGCGGCGAH
jgi:iron-sulfur cluster assembly protein